MLVPAAAGTLLGAAAVVTVGGLVVVSTMMLLMPASKFAPFIVGALLLVIFGFVFVVVYRDIMEKLTD